MNQKTNRILSHWPWLIFSVFCFIAVRGFLELDITTSDPLGYHIPFALRSFGGTTFLMNQWLRTLFDGYPPVAHWVQGALAILTGRMSAVNALSTLALALMAVLLLVFEGRKAVGFFFLSILAVPLLVLHARSGLIDLWLGVFLFCGFYCLYQWELTRNPFWVKCMGFFLCVACYSKYQAWPVTAVLLFVALARFLWLRKHRELLLAFAITAICAGWPVRNLYLYGNPTYPYPTPTFQKVIPGNSWVDLKAVRDASVPEWAREKSRPELFAISLFEASRWTAPDVPFAWTADQLFPENTRNPHFRLGGYSLFTMILFLFSIAIAAWFRLIPVSVAVAFSASLIAISTLSQGHELRYWLFIPLCFCFVFSKVAENRAFRPLLRGSLVVLMAMSAVYTLVKVDCFSFHPLAVADAAPAEAKAFWKVASPNSPSSSHLILEPGHRAIFWSGPKFNSFYVSQGD